MAEGHSQQPTKAPPRPVIRSGRTVMVRRGDAMLVIDVINDLSFDGAEKMMPWASRMVPRLVKLKRLAKRHSLPVIYLNDNFGHWRSSFSEVYSHCTRTTAPGRLISRRLKPARTDFFVLKPRHSGFFATSLVPLLEDLEIKRLILAGIATNLCVLFTAHDAHMHGYPIIVLSDCCAAESDFDHNTSLQQLKRFCGATVCRSTEIRFSQRRR